MPQVGMMQCKMTCNPYGMLWPVPNGKVELSNEMVYFYPGDISIIVAKDTPWKPTLLAVQLIGKVLFKVSQYMAFTLGHIYL